MSYRPYQLWLLYLSSAHAEVHLERFLVCLLIGLQIAHLASSLVHCSTVLLTTGSTCVISELDLWARPAYVPAFSLMEPLGLNLGFLFLWLSQHIFEVTSQGYPQPGRQADWSVAGLCQPKK